MMTREQLLQHDRDDPLASLRQCFRLPDGVIYLDGNSLGAMPAAVPERLREVTEQWSQDLIGSWNRHGWHKLPLRLGERLAPLLGAAPGQVAVCDSTSVNLLKVLSAAMKLRKGRSVILTDRSNFPTDYYVMQGFAADSGCRVVYAEHDRVTESLDQSTAVVALTQLDFRSGSLHDIEQVTAAAHDVGALTIWDLAHSAGIVPLQLDAWDVDLAVGCSYKYLNGGPGGPAYIFVRDSLQSDFAPILQGWHGHADPFAFQQEYVPADGIDRALCGTPPILSMAALDCALDVYDGIAMDTVRDKSVKLTQAFIDLVEQECGAFDIEVVTPRDPARRGGQVALRHPKAFAAMQALIAGGVVGDFREPDIMRFGFAPLYIRFVDVWDAVTELRRCLEEERFLQPQFQTRAAVT